jgi:hypothetical protein
MSDSNPRERLEESLKSPYPSDGEVWNALLAALSDEFNDFEDVLDEVDQKKFVETADGEQLNKIADMFGLDRRRDEALSQFRARIKSGLRSQLTSATISEIRDVVAVMLNTNPDNIDVEEPFDLEPATITLDVSEQIADVDLSGSELINVADDIVAAGVSVGILAYHEHSETVAIAGESSWVRDQIGPAYWNEGRWIIDTWNEATQEFVSESPETLAVAGTMTEAIETASPTYWNEGRYNVDVYDSS